LVRLLFILFKINSDFYLTFFLATLF